VEIRDEDIEKRPPPAQLRRGAIINFIWGPTQFHILCVAASLCRIKDVDNDEEQDWVHCHGFHYDPKNPPTGNKPIGMCFHLIPASYIVRIALHEKFRIEKSDKKADTCVYPKQHPSSATALSIKEVSDQIGRLQLSEGSSSMHLYNDYVRDVSNRFSAELDRIKTVHNFELGDEFETAICKLLRRVLPQKYGVCRGFVVSEYGDTAGDDIIIYDRMRFPTLRSLDAEEASLKEHVPIEAVYAYIEAKHSLCVKGDGRSSFQHALNQVSRVKMLLDRRRPLEIQASASHPCLPKIANPSYGAIFCRHVRATEKGKIIEDPAEIVGLLDEAKLGLLSAPDYCVLGANVLLLPTFATEDKGQIAIPSPFLLLEQSTMNPVQMDGVGFGAGLSFLLWALDWIQLGQMPWPKILGDCTYPPKDK
jgi:hypothetical protein